MKTMITTVALLAIALPAFAQDTNVISSKTSANQSAMQTQIFLMSLMTSSVWEVDGTATFDKIDSQFKRLLDPVEAIDDDEDDDDDDC